MPNPHPYRLLLSVLLALSGALPAEAQQNGDQLLERASASRAKGQEGAPIFVYEFADFQCPHCARFGLEVFPRIDSAFVRTGRVHWVFVNLPMPSHTNSWIAHEAAVCAGAIADRFWVMHDRIFETQQEWAGSSNPGAIMTRLAREVGLPGDRFAACVGGDRVASLLLQDVIFAATSRVTGTPAFNVNNEHSVMGLKSFEEWRDLLERTLKAQGGRE